MPLDQTLTGTAPLAHWMRERESIRIKKERGDPPPWTDDRILRGYRFTNARREDDAVTRRFREDIRQPFADHPHLWWMLAAARMINNPAVIVEMIAAPGAWPIKGDFSPAAMLAVFDAFTMRHGGWERSAYTIPAPSSQWLPKMRKTNPKSQYIAEIVLGGLWRERAGFAEWFTSGKATLRGTVERLVPFPGFADFMAYQAVVEMRFTRLLRNAADVGSWAAAGPGTRRGLNRVHGRPVKFSLHQAQALREMREIYRRLREEAPEIAIDFSDVPNILCETDKWLRTKNGEGTPRNRYTGQQPQQGRLF
jgi:hypothetical protein